MDEQLSGTRLLRWLLLSLLLTLGGCATASEPAGRPIAGAAPFDGLIGFDDPYRCDPGASLWAMLTGVIAFDELELPTPSGDIYRGRLVSPPVPDRFRDQVGKPTLTVDAGEYRATIPLTGTWKGLALHSLVVVNWVESESAFYLVFDAPREAVLKVVNEAGFRAPPSGARHLDEEVVGLYVGVETLEGRGALYCAQD